MTRSPRMLQEDIDRLKHLAVNVQGKSPFVIAEMCALFADGYPARMPGSGEPGGGGGISDPTASAALHGGTPDARAAELAYQRYAVHIAASLQNLLQAQNEAYNYWQLATTRPAPDPKDRGFAMCANPRCPDTPAYAESRGRCKACAAYLIRTGTDRSKTNRAVA